MAIEDLPHTVTWNPTAPAWVPSQFTATGADGGAAHLTLIDQRKLPHDLEYLDCFTAKQVCDAIADLGRARCSGSRRVRRICRRALGEKRVAHRVGTKRRRHQESHARTRGVHSSTQKGREEGLERASHCREPLVGCQADARIRPSGLCRKRNHAADRRGDRAPRNRDRRRGQADVDCRRREWCQAPRGDYPSERAASYVSRHTATPVRSRRCTVGRQRR